MNSYFQQASSNRKKKLSAHLNLHLNFCTNFAIPFLSTSQLRIYTYSTNFGCLRSVGARKRVSFLYAVDIRTFCLFLPLSLFSFSLFFLSLSLLSLRGISHPLFLFRAFCGPFMARKGKRGKEGGLRTLSSYYSAVGRT